MAINKGLLDILACPKCKESVRIEKGKLVCNKCRLRFPIIEGDIPDMLIEDAERF